jgi:outer membrane protein assembly factor BamB
MDVIRADTGQIDFTIPVEYAAYEPTGLLADNNEIYPTFTKYSQSKTYSNLYSMNALTGKVDWINTLSAGATGTDIPPVATPDYIVYDQYNGISLYDRKTGQFKFEIKDDRFYNTTLPADITHTPVFDAATNTIYEGYRYAPYGQWFLAAFDLSNKKVKWTTPIENETDGYPAVAGNEIFIVAHAKNNDVGDLQSLDTATGKINWTWHPDTADNLLRFNFPIVTADLIFIKSYNNIYAISRQTHQKVWQYASTGYIAIGNNILFILDHTYRKVPNSNYDAVTGLSVTAIALK